MKIAKGDAYSVLSFFLFCFVLGLSSVEMLQSIGWLDPAEHLEHWFVAILLALYLPQLWSDAIPPKKSAIYRNAQAVKAYRKGQRAEQMARGMAGTDAYRDDFDALAIDALGYGAANGTIVVHDDRNYGVSIPITGRIPPDDTQ